MKYAAFATLLCISFTLGSAHADGARHARELKPPKFSRPKRSRDLKVPDFGRHQRRSDLHVPPELARTDLHTPDFDE
jgi:hypothetical protein